MARLWSGREGKDLSAGSSRGLIIGSLGRAADPSPQQRNAAVSVWGFGLYNTWQRTSAISTSCGWSRSSCRRLQTFGARHGAHVRPRPRGAKRMSDSRLFFFSLLTLEKRCPPNSLSSSASERSHVNPVCDKFPLSFHVGTAGREQTSLPENDYACNISRITMSSRHSWNVSPSLDIPELSAITSVRHRFSFFSFFLFFLWTKTQTRCRIPALFLPHT